jgi:hypothetical protein
VIHIHPDTLSIFDGRRRIGRAASVVPKGFHCINRYGECALVNGGWAEQGEALTFNSPESVAAFLQGETY